MNPEELESLPPYSPTDERGLLSCLIQDASKCLPEFVADFQGEASHFYDSRHQVIFGAVRWLADARQPVDLSTLAARLTKSGTIEDAGGLLYLNELADASPSAGNLRYFAAEVRDCRLRRLAIQGATEVLRIAREGTAEDAATAAEKELTAIATARCGSDDTSIRAAVIDTISDWQTQQANGKKPGLPSGLGMLDVRLRGMRPGQLIVIAGRPGDGKTSLAMQAAEHVAVDRRTPVGVFSLEMTREELVGRMIAGRAGVTQDEATQPFSGSPEAAEMSRRLAKAAGEIGKSPLHVSDRCGLTMGQIRAQARLWAQRHNVALLVIDYLGLIRSANSKASAYERVSEISVGLKALAKELQVPVIGLSQLNRKNQSEDRAPDLHDLRDSGSVEQDADVVVMLHPDGDDDDDGNTPFKILIRKHRHARRGEVPVIFNRRLTRFEPKTTQPSLEGLADHP
ncbi:MAG: AAA family ATPase [Verrucomicrobia bacterium]|nr:AAA family ATPase [Verrucomicrobiota bacterium]